MILKKLKQILDLGENIFMDAVVPVAICLCKATQIPAVTLYADLTKYITVNNAKTVLSNIKFLQIEQESWNKVYGRYRDVEPLNINFEQLFETKRVMEYKDSYNTSFYMEDFRNFAKKAKNRRSLWRLPMQRHIC